MQFEQQTPDALLVSGYSGTGFVVAGRPWPAVLVTPSRAFELAARDLATLDLAAFDPLAAHDPATELLLIGTGPAMRRPPAALMTALAARGIAVEFMDSRAAARTYNVLVSEGRRVAAALLPTG
jgi:uncharacterized protein